MSETPAIATSSLINFVHRLNRDMSLTFAVREAELSIELRDALEGQYHNQEVSNGVHCCQMPAIICCCFFVEISCCSQ